MQDTIVLSAVDPQSAALMLPSTSEQDRIITYGQLQQEVDSLSVLLCELSSRNASIAVALPNGAEFVATLLSILKSGRMISPLNSQRKPAEANRSLSAIRPELVIVKEGATSFTEAAQCLGIPVLTIDFQGSNITVNHQGACRCANQRATPVTSDTLAVQMFTSGTTGPPKCVQLSHGNLLQSIDIITKAHNLTSADRCFIVTPMYHIAGLCASLLCTLMTGGCAVIPERLDGSFWTDFNRTKATWYHAVPSIQMIILDFDCASPETLRFVRCGGSAISNELYRRSKDVLKVPVLEIYGLTETSPGIFCNTVESASRPGRFPIAQQVDVRIYTDGVLTKKECVVGELCVRGPSVMKGYLEKEQNSKAFIDGYFRTGDIAQIFGSCIELQGRIKDFINRGGEKISPLEVEDTVLQHEKVQEAAAFPIFDEVFEEDIGIAIILQSGMTMKPMELKAFMRQKVSSSRIPRELFFVEEIPKTDSGKYQRAVLSKRYWSTGEADRQVGA